jgi:hypothetical protein
MAKNLNEVSALLAGLETGIHSDLEIAVASRTAEYLAMDPTVASLDEARELISAFQRDAARRPMFAWWLVLIFPINPRNADDGHYSGTTHSRRSYCRSAKGPILRRP